MRKKNIIFGVICFALAVVTGGQAFAALAEGEISMGVFSIPLPGCAPEVTISEKDTSSGCYTMTVQNKTLQNGVCSSSGITPTTKQVCDGKDGENGAGGAVDVTKVYVPYPASTFGGAEPQNEGYIKVTIPAADDGEDDTILKYPDYCEEFYEDGLTKKKCTAQGDATDWANTSGVSPYRTGDNYIFSIDGLEAGYPRLEYVRPVLSSGTSGYPTEPGYTKNVTRYENGREQSDLVAIDSCDKYAKSTDTSDRVTKCTVGAPAGTPGATSPYTPGVTYCLGNHQNDCGQYTIPVGAVDVCAGLTSSDNAWGTTVSATESEYVAHVYPVGGGTCTTNCTGTIGYKLTKEVMCDGNVRTNKVYDTCSSATAPSNVTCATGYAYQQCTPVDSRASANSYSGCFPDPLNGKYALRDEIVPVSLAADSDYLYYCKVSDCNVASCWVNGSVGGTPYYNDGNGCWGRVSVQGLQGENGESCFVTNDGTNWNMCCSPTYAGNDCSIITDDDIINKLNGMMCQVNYTHRYLHDDGNGGFTANTTKDGARGERVIVTNSCNDSTENLDTYYGEDGPAGDDYNPCDGLSSAEALSTVSRRTTVYVRHGSTNSSTTTTGIGYYTETNVMCDTSGNKIVKKYDKCDPVSLASGASRTVGGKTCSGNQTLLMCTPQEEPTTPYYVCSDAEVSNYPKLVYVAPTVSDGKFTARGYTKWVHKYTSDGPEVDGVERHNPDECHTVYKRTFGAATDDGTGVRTATTTTLSTLKCTVQTPGAIEWAVGAEYCLNTTSSASTSCNGYSENTSDVITSTLRYHLPIMGTGANSNTPLKPGYTYDEEASGAIFVRGTNQEYDKCETLLTRTNSGSSTVTASVTRCTVGAPTGTPGLNSTYTAGATYCLGYANGTCPGSLIDIGSAIDDAAENDPCAGISGTDNLAKAVKKVVSRTYTPATATAKGSMLSTYTMCNNTPLSETIDDICKEIPKPTSGTGSSCNGAWMQCSNQTLGSSDTNKVYYYCDTTGTSIFSTISGNDPCGGDTTSEAAKKKVKSIQYEYVARNATGNTAKVGYSKKTTTMCNTAGNTEEYIYDTCVSVAAASGCNGASDKNYKCYNQTKSATAASSVREYNTCNPSESAVALSSAVANKLDSDVTFTTGTYNNKDYILMSATGITTKPVVPVDELKPQSLFEIWKDQYKDLNNTKCSALFGTGKTCSASGNNLNESDMLANMNAYGVWKTDQVVTKNQTNSSNLTFEKYQQSLQPCQTFDISEDSSYSGNDGKRYTMTCVQ